MPYSGSSDSALPDHVKKAGRRQREAFVGAFNSTHEKCKSDGGEDCEAKAMKSGNAAMSHVRHVAVTELLRIIEGELADLIDELSE